MTDRQYEEFKLSGDEVIAKVKEIIREGNARRLILKNENGVTLIEVPLTVGVVGAVLLPVWAAIGAAAAVAARLTLIVEKRQDPREDPGTEGESEG
jgi:Flp pilus assembly pilin Flp